MGASYDGGQLDEGPEEDLPQIPKVVGEFKRLRGFDDALLKRLKGTRIAVEKWPAPGSLGFEVRFRSPEGAGRKGKCGG